MIMKRTIQTTYNEWIVGMATTLNQLVVAVGQGNMSMLKVCVEPVTSLQDGTVLYVRKI